MADTKHVVTLQNISHSYGDRPVLSSINLSFQPLITTAILGKSGSGKSTLLQMINGLIRPTQGTVSVFDKPIDYQHLPQLRLQIGYVVQQVGLFPHMTIEDNILLLGKINHRPKEEIRSRLHTLMNMVQLPQTYCKKYPHQLSGGEQQRAGLCRAMLLNPSILLLDEPFASLDYTTKHGIYGHLATIQQTEPRTVILITHDWTEAEILGDRFVWLDSGHIKQEGDQKALESIKSFYTASS